MISSSNTDGKKKCTCKKSKCLKLYCECFAAGFYCDESCSCQDCYNSRDYEDTVDETREQIELRNPLAFSSKIHSQSVVDDGDKPMPIAGKHKRGCNCKKSMCMKRYCECYQANVGCSDECRCEGCKNAFGKKEGYNVNVYNESTSWTPIQYSGHGEDTSTNRLFSGCYLPTPESANSDMMLGTSNVESMSQFTPPDSTHINAWQNSSRASGNLSSVTSFSWPGSLVTPMPLFGAPNVDDSNEIPIDTIDENMPNTGSFDSYIQPNISK